MARLDRFGNYLECEEKAPITPRQRELERAGTARAMRATAEQRNNPAHVGRYIMTDKEILEVVLNTPELRQEFEGLIIGAEYRINSAADEIKAAAAQAKEERIEGEKSAMATLLATLPAGSTIDRDEDGYSVYDSHGRYVRELTFEEESKL
jgi:hypothetical protein